MNFENYIASKTPNKTINIVLPKKKMEFRSNFSTSIDKCKRTSKAERPIIRPQHSSERDDRFENLSSTVVELSQTVTDLQKTVANLEKTVNNLSKTVDNLSKTVDNLSKTVDNLSKKFDMLLTKFIEKKLNDAKRDNVELQNILEQYKKM